MKEAVDQEDYRIFFEYKMDLNSESGVVGREATEAAAEFGENICTPC
ncbi:MAG: hypothetical protein M3270_02120 [Thermoproteota archaeon]|nr:hypothetical protein [Thermoproteota archaeon]